LLRAAERLACWDAPCGAPAVVLCLLVMAGNSLAVGFAGERPEGWQSGWRGLSSSQRRCSCRSVRVGWVEVRRLRAGWEGFGDSCGGVCTLHPCCVYRAGVYSLVCILG